jgi:hypothetical protein
MIKDRPTHLLNQPDYKKLTRNRAISSLPIRLAPGNFHAAPRCHHDFFGKM